MLEIFNVQNISYYKAEVTVKELFLHRSRDLFLLTNSFYVWSNIIYKDEDKWCDLEVISMNYTHHLLHLSARVQVRSSILLKFSYLILFLGNFMFI